MTGYSDPRCKDADGAVHAFGGKVWTRQCEGRDEGKGEGDAEDGGGVEGEDDKRRRLTARTHHLHAHLHHMRDAKLQVSRGFNAGERFGAYCECRCTNLLVNPPTNHLPPATRDLRPTTRDPPCRRR